MKGRLQRFTLTAAVIALAGSALAPSAAPAATTSAPLAAVSSTTSASRSHTFELTRAEHPTAPVHWLACKPIEYRVNTAHMPKRMIPVVQSVFRSIQHQTGARFRYAGHTTHGFSSSKHAGTPTIYLAFTDRTHVAGQDFSWPGQIGVGGPAAAWYLTSKGTRFESITYGRVLLSTKFRGPRTGGGASWRSLIMHEVGHALNLEHRAPATDVMHASLTDRSPSKFSASEVKALNRVLQRTRCDYAAWKKL